MEGRQNSLSFEDEEITPIGDYNITADDVAIVLSELTSFSFQAAENDSSSNILNSH